MIELLCTDYNKKATSIHYYFGNAVLAIKSFDGVRQKGKEIKKKSPGKKLAVAKPCIFAQQSASHAANAAKKGWRLRPQARVEKQPRWKRGSYSAQTPLFHLK